MEQGLYPAEPIFIASPDATEEDDGVLLRFLSLALSRMLLSALHSPNAHPTRNTHGAASC
jgi:hypothetical protein